MKRLLIRLIQLAGAVAAAGLVITAFALLVLAPQYTQSYTGSMVDKVERLMSIQEPKLILVGNSNLVFGIDSPMLEDALGVPVVNMGFQGSISNAVLERFAKLNIGQGDIVVVSQTDYLDVASEAMYLLITLENHWSFYPVIGPENIWPMMKSLPKYVERLFFRCLTGADRENPEDMYGRCYFNAYGDNVYPRNDFHYTFPPGSGFLPPITDECVQRLNAFHQYCHDRGAFLVVAAYPIGDSPYAPSREELDAYQQELRDKLECPVISNFNDYRIPESYFYDTYFHLTNEGAKLRTEQLILDLQAWLQAPASGD